MAGKVHLRLPATELSADSRVSWLHIPDRHNSSASHATVLQGTLRDLGDSIGNDTLVVYIPAINVSQTRVDMPAGRQAQLLRALPFALEDELIDDVDDLHCVLGPHLQEGRSVAAVIKREIFEQYIAALREVDLHPRQLLPETLLLPWQEKSWSVYCDNQQDNNHQLLVRTGTAEGFTCHRDTLASFLQQALNTEGASDSGLETVRLFNCDTQLPESLQSIPLQISQAEQAETTSQYPDDLLGLLLQHDETNAKLNMLQGEYAPVSRLKQQLQPWIKVAAMAGVLLLLGLITNNIEYYQLKKQKAQLHQQMVSVLKKTFPSVTRVSGDPYSRFKSEEKKIKLSGSDQGFNVLLAQITPVATKADRVAVRHLRYRDGQMELTLELPDLQTLENLKKRLAEATSLKVELKSANTADDKVQGRIVISKS